MKVLITNKSKFPQRITILNPTTPYFKTQITRRGIIPAGLSEVVVVSFFPTEYTYYYDNLAVFCEGENLCIPIHGFPAINDQLTRYLPKLIDFGVVPEEGKEEKEVELANTADVPFEFEVVPQLSCEEIQLNKLYGRIPASDSLYLEFTFNPKKKGIFVAEYQVYFAEFDKAPEIVRVTGSCNDYSKVTTHNIGKETKPVKKVKRNDSIEIKEEDDFNATPLVSTKRNMPSDDRTSKTEGKGLTKRFKYIPSNKEREFLKYFNHIEEIIKSKEIKYNRFVGKPLPTSEEKNAIMKERLDEKLYLENIDRKVDIERNKTVVNTTKVILDKNSSPLVDADFDSNKNLKFFKQRYYFDRFLGCLSKIIVRNRADKRLAKLKDMVIKVAA